MDADIHRIHHHNAVVLARAAIQGAICEVLHAIFERCQWCAR